MSKNIIIQEGGSGKQATVSKLEVNNVGGGTSLWVPEDETQVTSLYVTQNGEYRAEDEGWHGYNVVTVSGIGQAVGYGSSGNEVLVTADDETGELVETDLASSIHIMMTPLKTRYYEGETIDFTGILVRAFKNTGVWEDEDHLGGDIPIEELYFSDTIAQGSGEEYPTYQDSGTITISSLMSTPTAVNRALRQRDWDDPDGYLDEILDYAYAHTYCPVMTRVSLSQGNYEGWSPLTIYFFDNITMHDTVNLSQAYPCTCFETYGKSSGSEMEIQDMRQRSTTVRMFVGEREINNGIEASNIYAQNSNVDKMQIMVQWDRVGDYKTLQDSFEITVIPAN